MVRFTPDDPTFNKMVSSGHLIKKLYELDIINCVVCVSVYFNVLSLKYWIRVAIAVVTIVVVQLVGMFRA